MKRSSSTGREPGVFRYLLFNKPFNVLSQFTRGAEQTGTAQAGRTLADFISVPDVYPAGRLDYDSEGLLLLTSDGHFQHRISDPRFAHPRTYWVQVEGLLTERAVDSLREGIPVRDYVAKATAARVIQEPALQPREPPIRFRKNIPTSWLEIALAGGRNRQVRRMTAAIGFPTLRLVRSAIGPLRLTGLEPGSWRDLTGHELDLLRPKTRSR
jgi:23S rRNA pseudouridine2457 synthase